MSLEGVLDEKHLGPSSPRLAVAIDYIKFSCAV